MTLNGNSNLELSDIASMSHSRRLCKLRARSCLDELRCRPRSLRLSAVNLFTKIASSQLQG